MRSKNRILDLLQQVENHNRAMEAGLNRKYPHDQLLVIIERIQNTVDEITDLVEVEDDEFQTRTGFLE